MKKLTLLLALLPALLFSQVFKVEGVVYDKATKKPLPFVNITVNGSKMGSAADLDGVFEFSSQNEIKQLKFSYIGYETYEMELNSKTKMPLKVYLKESVDELDQIELVAGENPAHKIIRKATANRKINNPEALPTFSYTSYNKFVVTFKVDSATGVIDTNWVNENTDSADFKVDSSGYQIKEFFDKQHLFLMESVSERKYSSSPKRNNEKVIASRVSGLKNPTFTLLATQLQSFSFYNDFITVLDKDYINPISKGSTNRYIFIIQDTVFEGPDSTFIISYQPNLNAKFEGLEGVLYITSDGWALKNVLASPQNLDGFTVEIQSKSEKFGDVWFPTQINYDYRFFDSEGGDVEISGAEPLGIGRTYISKIKLKEPFKRKDFSRIEVKVTDKATKQDEEFWNQYRVNPLDSQDLETYRVIDSVGEAENFEQKLAAIQALLSGRYRYKFLDFDLNRLLGFNIYEGLRIGVGAHTNYRMLEWMSLGGYVAYGFKDQRFKYMYEADFFLNQKHGLKLNMGYSFDIAQTAQQEFNILPRTRSLLNFDYRNLNQQQFDEVSKVYLNLDWNVLPNLHTRFFANRQNRFSKEFGYRYLKVEEGVEYLQNGFNSTQIGVSLQFAPNDKYMEGEFGRKPIEVSYPVYEVQYTRSIPGVWDSEIEFDKIDARIIHEFKTKKFGNTRFEIAGGYVNGDQPYSYLYTPVANRPVNVEWPIILASVHAFETMYNNEFLSNQWVHFMFRQNFKGYLLKIGKWNPDVEWTFAAIVGSLNNLEKHKVLEFNTLDKGYFESGLEINKIWSTLGVGVYYRFGPYHLPDLQDNFAVKLTARFSLF